MAADAAATRERKCFAALAAAAVAILWLAPLPSSLWLDETGTFWVIKDGLAKTLTRAMYWPAQSPLYYITAWLAYAIGGAHETVLRIPSILAMGAAAILLYRLTARLFDEPAARMSTLAFLCLEDVAFAAADARPYALGLCFLMAAALMLVNWLETGRARYAAAYAVASALAAATQCMLALGLAPLAVYGALRARAEKRVRLRALAAAWLATGLLMLPLVIAWSAALRGRSSHSFADPPNLGALALGIAPAAMTAAVALALILSWISGVRAGKPHTYSRNSIWLILLWVIFPPLLCFLISVFTSARLFVPRYFIAAAPAQAIAAGTLLRANLRPAARIVAAFVMLLATIPGFWHPFHGPENWIDATAAARAAVGDSEMPVLAASGFIEASDPASLNDPKMADAWFAPFSFYPIKGRIIRLPFRPSPASIKYLDDILAAGLLHEPKILFIARRDGTLFEPWLTKRLAPAGYRSRSLGVFGGVSVFEYAQ